MHAMIIGLRAIARDAIQIVRLMVARAHCAALTSRRLAGRTLAAE